MNPLRATTGRDGRDSHAADERRRVAVAAPNRAAADAGTAVAALGGNAVDAALAAMLVTCVNEPGMVSLGGGAFVTVAVPGEPAVVVDGYVEMPGRGLPESAFGGGVWSLHTAYGGGTTMSTGPGTVATPGLLPGLEEAHRRYGRLDWAAIVEPAVQVARAGFTLSMACDYFLSHVRDDLYGHDPLTRAALHHEDGTPVRRGEQVRILDLADFLEAVQRTGSAALTRGEAARSLVALMEAGGGLVTAADLAEYTPVVRPAATVDLARGWRLATNPPPAIGGPVLGALLALLDGGPDGGPDDGSDDGPDDGPDDGSGDGVDPAALVRATRSVLGHRARVLDVSDDLARDGRALLEASRTGRLDRLTSPSTAHVSAVDDQGRACSVTTSFGYGSGITLPGTGVWLNNCLGEHELNVAGLHALPPGTRLASNMAPSVARRDDGTVLAVGSPGADRITTALAQVIARLVRVPGPLDGDALAEAIRAPRLHVSRDGDGVETLHHEADLDLAGLGGAGLDDVRRREHVASSMYFGGVAAVLRTPDGDLIAAADPRRDGATAVGG